MEPSVSLAKTVIFVITPNAMAALFDGLEMLHVGALFGIIVSVVSPQFWRKRNDVRIPIHIRYGKIVFFMVLVVGERYIK